MIFFQKNIHFQLNCVVVPTKALADPAELDRALAASLTASLTSGIVNAAAGVGGGLVQVIFIYSYFDI